MKPELLEKLLDAGFTKDEIIQLARNEPIQATTEPTQEPTQEPAQAVTQEPTQEPAQEPTQEPEAAAQTPEPDKTAEKLNGIEHAIEELRKAVQANNLRNDSFGTETDSLETQTDKIMASIIRPEPAGKDGAK